ncbi:MAG: ferritin family protein [Planctomycetota bacterium]|nr:ferritin family protein [Planctomycetota bacterium]MDE1890137.1 ferritin family protein [Planctomycetota bacterium]MDE2216329.1 ferritin family protein [Planctomycetota bacterium]
MVTTDVKEIIKQAAEQEEKAYKFYTDALKFVKDAAAKLWIKELAAEEVKHKEMLLKFDVSKIRKFKPDKVQDLHIAEYLVDKDVTEIKDFQDVLIVAMKKEQKSYNFYVSMAKSTDNADMKKLCKILAQEELKHKHKIELYYDDIIFKED